MNASASASPRILVAGLGNVLMGDDAFGPYVVRWLEAHHVFPKDVAVRDLGTPGLDLTPHLAGVSALILVDTVHSTGAPGELRLYRKADILKHPLQPRTNAHDPGVNEALLLADALGVGPREALLVGVVPKSVATGVGLSPAVQRALRPAADAILAELGRLQAEVAPRVPAEAPDIWWEPREALPGD